MKKVIYRMVNQVNDDLKALYDQNGKFLFGNESNTLFHILLAAYNRYQADEQDFCGYLYDITNKDDVIACLNGRMSIEDVSYIFHKHMFDCDTTQYYMFGHDDDEPKLIKNFGELVDILSNHMVNIVYYMFCYPEVAEYRALYNMYVADTLLMNKAMYL